MSAFLDSYLSSYLVFLEPFSLGYFNPGVAPGNKLPWTLPPTVLSTEWILEGCKDERSLVLLNKSLNEVFPSPNALVLLTFEVDPDAARDVNLPEFLLLLEKSPIMV